MRVVFWAATEAAVEANRKNDLRPIAIRVRSRIDLHCQAGKAVQCSKYLARNKHGPSSCLVWAADQTWISGVQI